MTRYMVVGAIVIIALLCQSTTIAPNTPFSEAVYTATAGVPDTEKEAVAEHLKAIADEIDSLGNPLSTSTIVDANSALARLHEVLKQGSPQWSAATNALQMYVDAVDPADEATGHVDRTVFALGQQLREAAQALAPRMNSEQPDEELFEFGTDADIEQAYMSGQMTGVYLDEPEQPEEYREMAKQDEALFFNAQQSFGSSVALFTGEGTGRRAVYWNYAFRINPNAFRMKQITGNCVFASASTICTVLNGVNTYLLRQPNAFEGEGSTAFYAFRGHSGAGSSPSRAAWAYLEYGYPLMKDYQNGFDLRDSTADQRIGIEHWRAPEQTLGKLLQVTRQTPVGKIDKLPSTVSQSELNDLLYQGCCVHFGGTLIGAKGGDPISAVGKVGPHAMSLIGYDDTDEFKQWYKEKTGKTLTESVYIFDNTWGDGPTYVASNWYPLWGRQTGGTYVLKYSDARKLLKNAFVWYPDITGVTPAQLKWRLSR